MLNLRESFRNLKYLFGLTKSASIARRYFVIGAFDGALTVLGVIIGAYCGRGERPS
ncbi:MAG: hypothetical protein LN411_03550 [Candidatus Thermoplasmatota archaeon]|nr:hypothetical protein [Candidatus Thermoplasmatota archaeon]